MTSTGVDEVQLGSYDVPAQQLAAAGQRLVELVGEQGASSVDTLLGPPPVDGWRVIAGPFPPPPGEVSILAAPSDGRASNGWMQVSFTRRNGLWTAVINDDRRPLRPGRKHRRAGLQLQWKTTRVSAASGTGPVLRLLLRNVTTERWHADGIDHDHVRAWALGSDSLPLPRTPRTWGASAVQPLGNLTPDASVEVSATLDTDIAALPRGEYRIEAELSDLQLQCRPGILLLT